MKLTTLTLYLCIFTFIANTSFSQSLPDSTKVEITTKSGSVLKGHIVEENDQEVKLQVRDIGIVTIQRSQIEKMVRLESTNDSTKDWPYQFQTANYFTFSSAYGLKKKEGYYQNVWILFNNVSYGITDNLSIGLGTYATFFFTDVFPFWVTARYTTPIVENKFHAGIGGVFGSVEDYNFGFLYGMMTFGSRDRNITLGAGSGFGDDREFSDLLFTINGTFRAGPKFYLIMENYLVQEEGNFGFDSNFTFIGGRSILGRASLEYGLLTSNEFNFLGIPLLGITLPLHKDR